MSNLFGVIYFAVATRFLTVYEIGVTSSFFLVTTIFSTFFNFSIPAALAKFVPEYKGGGKVDWARGITKKGIIFGIIVSIISSIALYFSSSWISTQLFGSFTYQSLLEILALDVFAIVFLPFLSSVLTGLQKFRELSISTTFGYGIKYATAIILLNLNFGLLGVILAWVIGDFSSVFLKSYFLLSFRGEITSVPFSRLIKYSAPLYLAGIINYLSARIDQFLIIFYLGLANLGIYNAAITASWVVSSISQSMGAALFPQFAERFGRKDKKALSNAAYGASRYMSIIYLPLAVGLATVALPTISLVAGPSYIEGAIPLTLFSLTSAITCLSPIANSVISSLGKTKIYFWARLSSFSIDTILGVLFIPILGITGAAISKTIASIAGFTYVMISLKKIFGWNFDVTTLKKCWIGSIIMGLIVLTLQQFITNRFYLPLYILVGGVSYLVFIRLFHVVNKSDVTLIKEFLPQKLEFLVDIFAKFLVV